MNLITLLSVTFLAFQVVILAICVWLGYRRGTGRSIVRLIYLSLLAVLSFFLAKWIAGYFSKFGLSVAARFYTEPIKQLMLRSPQTEQLLGQIIAAMLVPVVFALIFAVLQLLSLIKLKTVSEKLTRLVKKDGDPMTPATRWIGAGLGAVQGLLIAAILLAPISCAVVILRSVDPEAMEALGLPGYKIEQTDTAGVNYSKNSLSRGTADITTVHKKLSSGGFSFAGFFADLLTEALTTIEGYDTNLADEVFVILNAAGEALKVYNEIIGSGMSAELAAVNALSTLLPYMEQSVLLPEISSQLLNAAADSWESDETFLGIKLPDKDSGPAAVIIGAVMQSFKNATPENVGDILNTLVGKNEGSTSVMENILSLTGDDVEVTSDESIELMANSLIVIGNNENMAQVIAVVGQIGSDLIKEYGITTIPADETGAYDEIKSALEEELNSTKDLDYESQVTSLANRIVSTAESYNYSISFAKAKLAAISLLSYFGSVENITVEGVMEYFGITDIEVSTNN
ncbi:MAG: CvpA family protein [Clostridiales bacterium]|nr:CvpA family protein [Clostridiales bacterium]HOA84889.1 CvpA family protein [Bacillota bacterium]